MNDIESLIALVAVAAVLVRFADIVGIPYPIVLVLGGLAVGLLPNGPEIRLDPEVIFLVFLPPLLQSAGYYSSPRELRAELLPLTGLVVILSLVTMAAVAAVAHAVIDEISWAEGFLLGAIVAPTDPVAAIATFGRVSVPDRVSTLVEGESMINDATALVAYKVALGAVLSGSLSAGNAAIDLVVGILGGIVVGLVVAWAVINAVKRLDDPPLAILLTVLMSYVAFSAAEQLGVSGVLAVVSGGLYLGVRSHTALDADTRLNAVAFWQVLVFALNAILFILLGLQFPDVIRDIAEALSTAQIVGYGLLIAAVVVTVRMAWQFLPTLIQMIYPRFGDLDTGDNWRERVLVGWSGMRGAVSLAAALAIPLSLDSGEAFADRELLIYLTVATIGITLVFQGLTLPTLIKKLKLTRTRAWAPEEAIARLAAAQAALDKIDEIENTRAGISETAIERLRELYRARFARCVASLSGEGSVPIENPLQGYRNVRRELVMVEREVLLGMRADGRLNSEVMRRIERDLDLEEARSSTTGPGG